MASRNLKAFLLSMKECIVKWFAHVESSTFIYSLSPSSVWTCCFLFGGELFCFLSMGLTGMWDCNDPSQWTSIAKLFPYTFSFCFVPFLFFFFVLFYFTSFFLFVFVIDFLSRAYLRKLSLRIYFFCLRIFTYSDIFRSYI